MTLGACSGDPAGGTNLTPYATTTSGAGGGMPADTTGSVTDGVTTGVTTGMTTGTTTGMTTGMAVDTGVGGSTTGVGGTTSTGGDTTSAGLGGSLGSTTGDTMVSTTTGGLTGMGGVGGTTTTSTGGAETTTGSGGTMATPVECTGEAPPSPPSEIQATIDRTWEEMSGQLGGLTGARSSNSSVENRMNLAIDQVMAAGGTLSFCVRWGSSSDSVSPELRSAIEDTLSRGVNEWFQYLVGYDCFPYPSVDVAVTGWATTNRDLLQWQDDAVPIYVTAGDGDGLPSCGDQCSSIRQGLDSAFPNCDGGYTNHYDQMLSLQDGLGNTGFGGNDGQWVDLDGYVGSTDGGLYHIWLHEFGHGIGFPDYYDWDAWGNGEEPPNSVMVAGRAIVVTEWDSWMMRRTWSEFKSRWDL